MKPFGHIYGDPERPSFITTDGTPVWMWRKRQRVRFFTADGVQVGPEHSNVFPAMLSAFAAGWQDSGISPAFNRACQLEVLNGARRAA